jgi:hypothetical protein
LLGIAQHEEREGGQEDRTSIVGEGVEELEFHASASISVNAEDWINVPREGLSATPSPAFAGVLIVADWRGRCFDEDLSALESDLLWFAAFCQHDSLLPNVQRTSCVIGYRGEHDVCSRLLHSLLEGWKER